MLIWLTSSSYTRRGIVATCPLFKTLHVYSREGDILRICQSKWRLWSLSERTVFTVTDYFRFAVGPLRSCPVHIVVLYLVFRELNLHASSSKILIRPMDSLNALSPFGRGARADGGFLGWWWSG